MKSGSFTLAAAFVFAFALNPATIARAEEAPKAVPPIPTLHCAIKTMSACSSDGKCKADKEVEGVKLPINLTIDFENSVVAAVDETGYARTDKMDQVAKTQDQLVLHGIDGEFGWQVLISDNTEAASLVMSTADSVLSGFGTCTNK